MNSPIRWRDVSGQFASGTNDYYQLTLNGGGASYRIKGDALAQILECFYDGTPQGCQIQQFVLEGTDAAHYMSILVIDFHRLVSVAYSKTK